MADTKLSGLTELAAAPAVGDLFYIVDISDTTDDAAGSSKKITLANVLTNPTITGTLLVLQTAGTPGTDQVEILHDGSSGFVKSRDGFLQFMAHGQAVGFMYGDNTKCVVPSLLESAVLSSLAYVYVSTVLGFSASFGADPDVVFFRSAANVVCIGSAQPGTGGGQLEFGQVADVGTPNANSARIGAEDVAGTAELIASDEAGNETQITPHAADGPPELYDETPGLEHVVRTINRFTGEVVFLNMTRAALCAESGERKKCRFVETLDEYNARNGKNKTKLDWSTVQDEKQESYDKARAAEQKQHKEALAKIASMQAAHDSQRATEQALHAKWSALPEEEKAKFIEPAISQEMDFASEIKTPIVRQAKDIRKPVPAQLAAKGVQ